MRHIKGIVRLAVLVAAASIMAAAGPAAAETRTWTGNVDNDWFNGFNWTVVQGRFFPPPDFGDDLYIYSGSPQTSSFVTADGGGSITFDGPTASGTFDDGFFPVGWSGSGALTIRNGGLVENNHGHIGLAAGSAGTVTVDNGTWTNSGQLLVGNSGSGELSIRNGGQVANTSGYVGYDSGSTGTVTVEGGTWTNSGVLCVGYDGVGVLSISNGGQVANSNFGTIGFHPGSSGTATVNGGTWTNMHLIVGDASSGVLSIGNGGLAENGNGFIGLSAGSTGTVTVDNGTWTNRNWLYVGGNLLTTGGTGLLTISNGGEVNVGDTLKVWPSGTVELLGSEINTGSFILESGGTFTHTGGTLTVDGGTFDPGVGDYAIDGAGNPTLKLVNGANANLTADLRVADSQQGTLILESGATFSNAGGWIGYGSGSTGAVTVDNGTWTNSGNLHVGGFYGSGELSISNGGLVANYTSYIGDGGDSTGTVTVDNATWTTSAYVFVGVSGIGALTIRNGGLVENTTGYIGNSPGSTGAVTVDNATWTNSGLLHVGRNGSGELGIRNGGLVENNYGYIGLETGSTGTVTVDGADSTWTNRGHLYVGRQGDGALTIRNGGQVANTHGYIGYYASSTGTVTVDGADSTWTNSGSLYVGGRESLAGGTGELTVENGGEVNVADTLKVWGSGTVHLNGGAIVADEVELAGGAPFNTAAGSTLRVNTLTGFGDHPSFAGTLEIGHAGGSSSGSHTVGAGQSLRALESLTVGYDAPGSLSVHSGGQVVGNTRGYIGYFAGSSGTVTVDGVGSRWSTNGILRVGIYGAGVLSIRNGGLVENSSGFIGVSAGTGTVTVDNATWMHRPLGDLTVGVGSGSGALTIRNGGLVVNYRGYIGYFDAATGTVTVDNGTWTNRSWLAVGYDGDGALSIRNGGQVENTYGYIGLGTNSTSAVTVDGPGSSWTNSGSLYVGGNESSAGETGSLTVSNGGQVNVADTLKVRPTGTVELLGSEINTGSFIVEPGGTFTHTAGTLTVDGGTFDPGVGDYAIDGAGNPTLELINGGNTSITGELHVGYNAAGALTIRNGGQVASKGGSIGYHPGSSGTVTVDNGTWTNSLGLDVGSSGSGVLTISNGGQVETIHGYIGLSIGSTGAVTVDNGTWTNLGSLFVGYYGAGALTIRNGGQVASNHSYIGAYAGSTGAVTVDGVGSSWTNSGSLGVGGRYNAAGGTGHLTVSHGGEVNVADTLKVWPSGTVELLGSQINTGSFIVESGGTFTHTAGTLTVDGGTFDPGVVDYAIDGAGNPTLKLVNGANANLTADLKVADSRQGTLILESGAIFSSARGWIGFGSGSTGTVTVDNGTWTNSGILSIGSNGIGALTIRNAGQVANTHGRIGYNHGSTGTVSVDNATWTNSGFLCVGRNGSGELGIHNGGLVANSYGYIGLETGSAGTVTVDGVDSTWTNSGSLYVGGNKSSAGGTGSLTVSSDGTVDVGDMLKVWGPGTVNLLGGTLAADTIDHTQGGAFNFTGGRLHVDTFMGSLSNNGGTLAPGASPGTTVVTGDYTQQAGGTLEIEIGGLGAGSQYDHVNVTGQATLDGLLAVSLVGGYLPMPGDAFEILTCGSRSGEFAAATGLDHVGGHAGLELRLGYHAAGVRLTTWAMGGDANIDGFVDDDDLSILLANWEQDAGTITTWALGDFTADTDVDDDDLSVLLGNWAGPAPGGAPMPEPASIALLTLGALTLARRRRN